MRYACGFYHHLADVRCDRKTDAIVVELAKFIKNYATPIEVLDAMRNKRTAGQDRRRQTYGKNLS